MTDESTTLSSASSRLERRDGSLVSIDLRGNDGEGRRRSRRSSRRLRRPSSPRGGGGGGGRDGTPELEEGSEFSPLHHHSSRASRRRFATALERCREPPPHHLLLRGGRHHHHHDYDDYWCRLRYISLRNNVLDGRSELPLFFRALPSVLHTLEVLVIFDHDVGDDGAMELMMALTGKVTTTTSRRESTMMTMDDDGDDDDDVDVDAPGSACAPHADAPSTTTATTTARMPPSRVGGLRELYLSHCGIGCRGARAIADALLLPAKGSRTMTTTGGSGGVDDHDDHDHDGNGLRCLQVLSLGSNHIGRDGASRLASAFGTYPPLQRLVLHGNGGIDDDRRRRDDYDGKMITRQAFVVAGWGGIVPTPSIATTNDEYEYDPFSSHGSTNTTSTTMPPVSVRAMSEIFVPLALSYVRRRWEADRVLIRPHDVLRRRLIEMMTTNTTTTKSLEGGGGYAKFVDEHAECVPDVLSYLGRVGACIRRTSLHSSSSSSYSSPSVVSYDDSTGGYRTMPCHSGGWEICRACSAVHLNDLYGLFAHVPHLVATLRALSSTSGVGGEGRGGRSTF